MQMKAEKDYLAGMTYAKLADKYSVSEWCQYKVVDTLNRTK